MPYTFPSSSVAEPFNNPHNPDYFSRLWRARQSHSNSQLNGMPTSSELSVAEKSYYYDNKSYRQNKY